MKKKKRKEGATPETKNKKFSFSVLLHTFQGLSSPAGPVATILESTDREHFHHHGRFCWLVLV